MIKVIWIIASNAGGKTTQSSLLHNYYKTKEKEIKSVTIQDGIECIYTDFGAIQHVGKIGNNMCTGTDTLNSRAQIEGSFLLTLLEKDTKIVVLDGIMATGQWVYFLKPFEYIELNLIYLHFNSPEENWSRVQARRKVKTGLDEELSDKTKITVSNKTRQFYNLYNNVKDKCDKHIMIDATLPKETIFKKIIKFLENDQ